MGKSKKDKIYVEKFIRKNYDDIGMKEAIKGKKARHKKSVKTAQKGIIDEAEKTAKKYKKKPTKADKEKKKRKVIETLPGKPVVSSPIKAKKKRHKQMLENTRGTRGRKGGLISKYPGMGG